MPSERESATESVDTSHAPAPGGHYSQGILANGQIYVSGQLPIAADGSHNQAAPFEEQARLAMQNMLAVVEAADGSRDTVVRVTAYIVGTENWPVFNRVYAEAMGHARPARTVVPVPGLHYGYLVEIDAIALRRRVGRQADQAS